MATERPQAPGPDDGINAPPREAIAHRRLELHFQPVVSLAYRSSTTLEALPRRPHHEGGVLAPPHFFGIAEPGGCGAVVPCR